MSELKIVVVGAGFAARVVHLPGYAGSRAPVAAICDLDTARAQGLADQYHIPKVYSDWREMFDAEQPELVSVCLPNVFHREPAIAALKAGAHVLCEKPLATTVAEAHEMFDAARTGGRVLMAAQLFRFEPNARAVKRVIDSGALGEIYHVEVDAMRRLGIPTWGTFHQKSASVGGALLDIGVHMLDQALWLIGNPKAASVSAIVQRQFGHKPEIAKILGNTWDPALFDVEDFSVAFVRFENGATLVLRASWAAHIDKNFFGIRILGTEGGVTTEPPRLFHTRNGVLADESYNTLRPANTNELQMRAFLSALRGERNLPVKEEETMNVQRILNAAYRSAAEGREAAVED
jgi:predicted dehydrogenase